MRRALGSRYELIEPIGSGSMGQVWRGRSVADDVPVAVKLLRAELCGDEDLVGRFLQERAILVALRHPNLVAVRDLVAEGEELAIVMDLVEGPNLSGLCEASATRTLAPVQALELGVQILSGLDAVHGAGIVHRDVKPENVVVEDRDGRLTAKVADFGVAKMAAGAAITRMTSLIGTPEYLAPEIIAGADASPAADVYAAGVVLYELLFGRTPFGGGSVDEVLKAHRSEPPPRPDGVPDGLWAALDQMTAKEPHRRPTAAGAAALLATARPVLQGMGPFPTHAGVPGAAPAGSTVVRARQSDPSPSPPPTTPGARRRLPARFLAMGLGTVTVVVVAVALVPGSGKAQTPNTYSFVPDVLPNGLAVTRTWELKESGTAFHGELRLTNTTSSGLSDSFEETIPKSLAKSVDDISFAPAVDAVVERDPVVRYELKDLGAGEVASFAYDIKVPKGGDAFERLKAWADDQAEASGVSEGVSLASLSVSPEAVTLAPAQRFPLRVRGTLSDKTRAPPAVFGGLSWSAADPKVVAVADGTLTAVGPGTTEVTAQAGGLVAKVTVTVGDRQVAAPGPSSTAAGQGGPPPTAQRPRPTTTAPSASTTTTTSPAPTPPSTATPAPRPPPPPPSSIGVYYKADGRWNLRYSSRGGGGTDINVSYGAGAIAVVGDWNGDGVDTVGAFYPAEGRWSLRNSNVAGTPDISVSYGTANTSWPVVGDWNGDGVDTIGVYYPAEGRWDLRNSNRGGAPDISVIYGGINVTWPVVGDWNGDGLDTIGVYYPAQARWNLRNSNRAGSPEIDVLYGSVNISWPVAGDWNGDGVDTIGVFNLNEARWFLRNTNNGGAPDINVLYGVANSAFPVVGDWL